MTRERVVRAPTVALDVLDRESWWVCEGGPLASQTFKGGEIADRQRAATRCRNPHTPTAALACLFYEPTRRRRRVKDLGDVSILRFNPPTSRVG